VPADNKWFTRIVVAAAMIEAMEGLDLHFPKLDSAAVADLKQARVALTQEGKSGKPKK
jgi:hypothetical protein